MGSIGASLALDAPNMAFRVYFQLANIAFSGTSGTFAHITA